MKYEWKKKEKNIYLPKEEPSLVNINAMPFICVDGMGDPNTSSDFRDAIEVLYSLSYAIKMMPKNGITPFGYYDYTVFPLEGIWDLADPTKCFNIMDKSNLKFTLMIRQPDFVTEELFLKAIDIVKKKKQLKLLEKVEFKTIEDGLCVQMMHIGPFDEEATSFSLMEKFCENNNLKRTVKTHREIYLSDFRRVSKDKLKTVLRIMVKHIK
jgi:hypothetical protein